jgi:hypothetical protein
MIITLNAYSDQSCIDRFVSIFKAYYEEFGPEHILMQIPRAMGEYFPVRNLRQVEEADELVIKVTVHYHDAVIVCALLLPSA